MISNIYTCMAFFVIACSEGLPRYDDDGSDCFLGFFFVPQLYLWGSPLLGEIFAYVTVF